MSTRTSASASTRDRIIDAALRTFASAGFTGATTREIARKARVNEVTLFRLFKSKRALFSAVVSERSPLIPIRDSVDMDPKMSIDDTLMNNLRIVLRTLRDNKELYFVMMGDAWRQPKTRNLAYEASIKRGISFVTTVMARLMDEGKIKKMDPEIVARAWMGAVQFYFLTTDMLGEGTPAPEEDDRMIRGFVSTFLDGIRTSQGGVGR